MGDFIENNSFVMSQAEHSTNVLIFDLLNYNNILIFKSNTFLGQILFMKKELFLK